jgi:hypothetical protein
MIVLCVLIFYWKPTKDIHYILSNKNQEGLDKMGITRLVNGVEIDTSGGLRVLELQNDFYVVGQEMLIAVGSWEDGREEIRKIKESEC